MQDCGGWVGGGGGGGGGDLFGTFRYVIFYTFFLLLRVEYRTVALEQVLATFTSSRGILPTHTSSRGIFPTDAPFRGILRTHTSSRGIFPTGAPFRGIFRTHTSSRDLFRTDTPFRGILRTDSSFYTNFWAVIESIRPLRNKLRPKAPFRVILRARCTRAGFSPSVTGYQGRGGDQ